MIDPSAMQGGPQGIDPPQPEPQLIPLGDLMHGIDPNEGIEPPRVLIPNADQSTGVGQRQGPAAVGGAAEMHDDGLPGSRLQQMYLAYEWTKQGELQNALVAEAYYHGYQWTEEQLANLAKRKQPNTYFNELRKKIDSYIGIEQKLRRDPKAYPQNPKHEGDCDAAEAALRQVHDETGAPTIYSEAARDFFVRGLGVVWQGVERVGQELKVAKRHIPAINFFYDPRSMKWDFTDAKFMGEWGWFDVEDAADMFRALGREDSARMMEMLSLNGVASGGMASVGIPGEFSRVKADWWVRDLGRVRLCHIYYRHKGKWRCAYFCGSIKLYDAPSIYLDEYERSKQPFNAVSCNVDMAGTRYGVVKDLIPIQDAINQRHSKLLWMLNARQIITEKGAVDDINKTREEAKRPDGVIVINPTTAQGQVAKRFQIETMDKEIQGQAQLLESSIAMMQNYGPNPALLGKGEGIGQQSGRALLASQNAGMTEMSPVFERHREFKLSNFRTDWMLIRQFWKGEMWFRVVDNPKGQQFAVLNQQMINPVTGEITKRNDVAKMFVDIIIEEGPDQVVMTEELMQTLAQRPDVPASVFIELSGVRNKDYLLNIIQKATAPSPEIVAMQQKMAQLEALLQAASVDEKVASVEGKRVDTLAKLMAAFQPTPAPVDKETGQPMGQPTMPGDPMMGLMAMQQVFPLDFGAPTHHDILVQEAATPPGNGPMGPGGPNNAFSPQGGPGAPPQISPPANDNAFMDEAGPFEGEPQFGQEGGLPLPGPQSAMAFA